MRTEILGVGFDDVTVKEAAKWGGELLTLPGFHYVVTPNPELVNMARQDESYRKVLNGADLVLPDGIGVVYAAKILGRPLKGRCPGIDFASALMKTLAAGQKRLFLLGAKPGVAVAAAQNLKEQYPGLRLCGTHDGYFTDSAAVVEEPEFLSGQDEEGRTQGILTRLRELAHIHKIPIREVRRRGNPVKELVSLSADYELLVLGSTNRGKGLLAPNIGDHLARKAQCSVLLLAM
ncbi:MAG: glycosyltransferase [Clostridia bacterium]|nr:glycosyltransferase [Clostridia bacterium]